MWRERERVRKHERFEGVSICFDRSLDEEQEMMK